MEVFFAITCMLLAAFPTTILGELIEPCANNELSCVLAYFGVPKPAGELSDTGVAINVVVEYGYFNTTLRRPSMNVAGLNSARIDKFAVDSTVNKLLLVLYFPELHFSGDVQQYNFHETGELDVIVQLPYDVTFAELYTTTIFNLTNNIVDLASAETNSEVDAIPTLSTADVLAEAAEKYPFVAEIIASTYEHPDILTREYAASIGRAVTGLYWDRYIISGKNFRHHFIHAEHNFIHAEHNFIHAKQHIIHAKH